MLDGDMHRLTKPFLKGIPWIVGLIGLVFLWLLIGGFVVLVLRALSINAFSNIEGWYITQPLWVAWIIYIVIGYLVFMMYEYATDRKR